MQKFLFHIGNSKLKAGSKYYLEIPDKSYPFLFNELDEITKLTKCMYNSD